MKSHRINILYPLGTSPEIHTRANPQYLHGPGRECCRLAIYWEITHVNVVWRVLLSVSNIGPSRPKYIWRGHRVHLKGLIWEVLRKRDLVGVSPHSTGSLSVPLFLYVTRPNVTGRKVWGITWTILLANIFHPLSQQVNFSRRIEEKLNRAKGRVRKLERRRWK